MKNRNSKGFQWIRPIKRREIVPLTIGILLTVMAVVILASGQTGIAQFLLILAAVTLLRRRRGSNDE